jgi:hypothetical protein
MTRRGLPLAERLALRSKRAENGCLEWTGPLSPKGYGRLTVAGKKQRVHRAAYELRYGAIPNGLGVLHYCDNRRCFDPEHLFLGTAADNAADMVAKNRQAKGVKNSATKLTEQNVKDIRRLSKTFTQTELARLFKVSQSTISYVATRICWRHLPDRTSI